MSAADMRTAGRPLADWLAAGVAMILAFGVAALVLKLGDARFSEPFAYGADANSAQMVVKSVLDHGWYQHNPDLGFPYGQNLGPYAFVSGDNLQILLIELIGLFTSSAAVAMNVFFLLTFPLCALTAFVVLRAWGVSQVAAIAGGVLFAVLPYHFLHGEAHIFISAYYAIPLSAYLIVAAWRGEQLFRRGHTRATLLIAGACLVIGSAHVYYAVFAVLLAGLAAVVRGLAEGSLRRVVMLALPALLVVVVVGLNHSPNIIWGLDHPSDPALKRTVGESEQFGLKAAAMLLPVSHHRIGPLAHLRDRYENGTESETGEGDPQALGTLSALGVLGLMAVLLAALVRAREWRPPPLVGALGATTLTAFALGTVGGGSVLFSLLATPQLRAWARVAILIAFCGVAAVALALDAITARFQLPAGAGVALAAAVVLVGVLDQTTPQMAPDYKAVHASWTSDAAFVGAIQSRLPHGAAVFELPYEPFPEPQISFAPPAVAAPYDGVRPYLHSHGLKWSFGDIKGLHGDWQFALASSPARLVPGAAVAVGFQGLVFDRDSYELGGQPVESEVETQTGPPTFVSPDRRFVFYDLRPLAARLRARVGQAGLSAARAATLSPLQLAWSSSGMKSGARHAYRLALGHAAIDVTNPGSAVRNAQLATRIEFARDPGSSLRVMWPDGSAHSFPFKTPVTIGKAVPLRPGDSQVSFTGNAPADALYPDVAQPFNMRFVDPFVVDTRQLALLGGRLGPSPPATLLTPYGQR
jgi:phosphoglycerol transferase